MVGILAKVIVWIVLEILGEELQMKRRFPARFVVLYM